MYVHLYRMYASNNKYKCTGDACIFKCMDAYAHAILLYGALSTRLCIWFHFSLICNNSMLRSFDKPFTYIYYIHTNNYAVNM